MFNFFAAGTGVAPVRYTMEGLPPPPNSECLKWVAVYRDDRIFIFVYIDFYIDFSNFDYSVTFTYALSKSTCECLRATGYVHDMITGEQLKISKTKVCACGSADLIQSASSLLIKQGFSEKCFYVDALVEAGNV